jgi:hypothetical protein
MRAVRPVILVLAGAPTLPGRTHVAGLSPCDTVLVVGRRS